MYRSSILVFLCLAVPGFGKPSAPVNVTMSLMNSRNILRWSHPPGLRHQEHATYTVEFKRNIPKQNYNIVCVTQHLYCDLTLVSHDASVRVRATVGGNESDWVTISFDPSEKSYEKLPPPSHVTMDSVNLKNILRWNRPPGLREDEDVLYKVQYKFDYANQEFTQWNETRQLYCDLTSATYRFYARVKAVVGDRESDWVTVHFDPYEETVIGPPELLVTSARGDLELSFSGPYLNGASIKEKYGELDYHVFYWKKLDPSEVMRMNTTWSTATLSNLENWSAYCVKVQAYIADYQKRGQFSPVVCKETTDNGKTPAWQIALLFLGSLVMVMVVILVLCFMIYFAYTQYKSFPSYSIPQHLKEFLSSPFYSPPPLHTQPTGECADWGEELTFISEEREEHDAKEAA